MLSLEQMLLRLAVAMVLGIIIGLERELIGKEAGIRTCMMVAAGASIFAITAITLPYIIALDESSLRDILARNSGFLGAVANIVVGIGFLGAGIIIKTDERVRGVTTAALIWAVAAIGALAGLGLLWFAVIATVIISGSLYLMRNVNVSGKIAQHRNQQEQK